MKPVIKILIVFCLCIVVPTASAQDVVFKCANNYYAVKSSNWDAPLSELPTKRYMNFVNLNQLTLPFSGGWQGLDEQVRAVVQLDQRRLLLKEVLMYEDTVGDNLIGELRYKLKITPYYYLPITINFNYKGEIGVINNMMLSMSASLNYTYCDAIEIAQSSVEFYSFLKTNQVFDAMHGKILGAIPNIRLHYSNYFNAWVWEVYAMAQQSTTKDGYKNGKVAYIDAQLGKLLLVTSYRHFSDEVSLN